MHEHNTHTHKHTEPRRRLQYVWHNVGLQCHLVSSVCLRHLDWSFVEEKELYLGPLRTIACVREVISRGRCPFAFNMFAGVGSIRLFHPFSPSPTVLSQPCKCSLARLLPPTIGTGLVRYLSELSNVSVRRDVCGLPLAAWNIMP